MSEGELDFTLSPDELPDERARALNEAARNLDDRLGVLGPRGAKESAEGDLARAFATDEAELQRPEVYRVEDERLETLRDELPVTVAEQARLSRFYWLSFPISLWAREGRGFNQLQVKVDFNPDDADDRRPRTIDVLPDEEFLTRFKAESSLQIGLGADLKFSAAVPVIGAKVAGVGVEAGASVDVGAGTKTTLLVGPFDYEIRVPKVQHSNLGLDYARWRIDDAKMIRESDPGLRVVLRVPREEPRLVIHAQLRARRYFNMFDASLQQAIRDLPDRFKEIFTGGAALGHAPDPWDLSNEL